MYGDEFCSFKAACLTLLFRYLVAKLLSPVLGCSIRSLRLQNIFALSFIFFKVLQLRRLIQPRGHTQRKAELFHPEPNDDTPDEEVWTENQTPFSTALSAFNVASFPPLFFFGALYYTDVMSTAAVLISYDAFIKRTAKPQRSIADDLFVVFVGVVALLFRQTNIFWVAVFPAGLTVIQVLKENGHTSASTTGQGYLGFLQRSWSEGLIYDRSLKEGGLSVLGKLAVLFLTMLLMRFRCCHVLIHSCNRSPKIAVQDTEIGHPLYHPSCPVRWVRGLERQRRTW